MEQWSAVPSPVVPSRVVPRRVGYLLKEPRLFDHREYLKDLPIEMADQWEYGKEFQMLRVGSLSLVGYLESQMLWVGSWLLVDCLASQR